MKEFKSTSYTGWFIWMWIKVKHCEIKLVGGVDSSVACMLIKGVMCDLSSCEM
jgi:hypothetical protein